MHAEIRTIQDPTLRVRVVEERISFDQNPQNWFEKYQTEQTQIRERIEKAQEMVKTVSISREFQYKISTICSELGIEGLRGDLVSTRAAKAIAAFENRTEVTEDDIRRTLPMCLRHRLRRDPMESINSGEKIEAMLEQAFSDSNE
jgi:magnesium chelatase subunit I